MTERLAPACMQGSGDVGTEQALLDGQQQGSAEVPFVLLAFDSPKHFAAELQDGCCQQLLQLAAQHHPGCSLGIWVHNFDQWCMDEEGRDGRAGRRGFSAARLRRLVAKLTCPGVQLKDVSPAVLAALTPATVCDTAMTQLYRDFKNVADSDQRIAAAIQPASVCLVSAVSFHARKAQHHAA